MLCFMYYIRVKWDTFSSAATKCTQKLNSNRHNNHSGMLVLEILKAMAQQLLLLLLLLPRVSRSWELLWPLQEQQQQWPQRQMSRAKRKVRRVY